MTVHHDLPGWRTQRAHPHWQGRRVGFVPTMGALHAGHRSLLERARSENDLVVLSILVNPTQFDRAADLAAYPRTPEADLALAEGLADHVLMPDPGDMYPDHFRYRLVENWLAHQLEGVHRPGHFEGVLTVVLKLLHLVQPHRAYFGEKDWQQLELVRGMVEAFFLPAEIVACPTVREPTGLACSSRNARLTPAGRERAAAFPRILREASDSATALRELRHGGFEVDYVEDREGVRLGAIWVEGVRLIDNVCL